MGDSWWLVVTNAALGIAVFICFAVIVIGVVASVLKKRARQERVRLEIRKF
jgi:hypothetical protein